MPVEGRHVKLSVVIITLNEQRNIGRCLESVAPVADEIVVVDAGSSDGTEAICHAYGAKFFVHPFTSYGAQRNEATRKASFDYILSIDADEALTPLLARSIREAKRAWRYDCYRVCRLTAFCGRWIRHGEWYPDRVVRLFDRRRASWKGVVHERVVSEYPRHLATLEGILVHHTCYSVFAFCRKTERYASLMAADLFSRGIRTRPADLYLRPAFRFFSAYILRRGFLDGAPGYCIALLAAKGLARKFMKLKILQTYGPCA